VQTAAPAPEPEFDLAGLPPIESITATTDMRAFLAPGVPPELMRAALRRAWVEDPAIRNFVGPAEYDWDFTDPAAMSGFGDLPPGYDVRKLLAEVLGEAGRASEPSAADQASAAPTASAPSQIEPSNQTPAAVSPTAPSALAPSGDETDQADTAAGQAASPAQLQAEFVQNNKNIATQSKNTATQNKVQTRPKHGGALPE
jgi:hypothetical protein